MGLYKVKDTLPYYARRKRNSRQITLLLSSGSTPPAPEYQVQGQRKAGPSILELAQELPHPH